ncbi:hypothetical protein WR25_00188 [Diploscapter pachys]|uniref:DUF4604 domain-containing protein n=1 Tax=Diploscapter pachys TaxID=2018661 RepID=A0A2A2J4A9_9BILA|nr:hypothetical protein WR25_00188 [Diploscapter pachys]
MHFYIAPQHRKTIDEIAVELRRGAEKMGRRIGRGRGRSIIYKSRKMSGRGRGKPMNYKEKSGISYINQEDPPFIQKMKKQLGYKEPAKLDDKFTDEPGPNDVDDDGSTEAELLRMKEEDRPQIVVLNPETDIGHDEIQKKLDEKQKEEDDRKIAEGRITFKKPAKRNADSEKPVDEKKKKLDEKKEKPKVSTSLLSFGDDEEDE